MGLRHCQLGNSTEDLGCWEGVTGAWAGDRVRATRSHATQLIRLPFSKDPSMGVPRTYLSTCPPNPAPHSIFKFTTMGSDPRVQP